MVKAIAWSHGVPRVVAIAEAFAAGCRKHGIDCSVRPIESLGHEPPEADVVWMYGLGPAMPVFRAYAGRALRIVGDVGYWRELMPHVVHVKRYSRISIEAQQPDAHLRLRPHPATRFDALKLNWQPVEERGDAILVCGCSLGDAERAGLAYGQWETAMVRRLQGITRRRIVIREKPKNPPIDAPGAERCSDIECSKAVRKAWAVVCRTGNLGADALLHGVPVWAEQGPGAVYGMRSLDHIDWAEAPAPADRLAALADLAHWQWTPDEMAQGKLWQHLTDEGMIAA